MYNGLPHEILCFPYSREVFLMQQKQGQTSICSLCLNTWTLQKVRTEEITYNSFHFNKHNILHTNLSRRVMWYIKPYSLIQSGIIYSRHRDKYWSIDNMLNLHHSLRCLHPIQDIISAFGAAQRDHVHQRSGCSERLAPWDYHIAKTYIGYTTVHVGWPGETNRRRIFCDKSRTSLEYFYLSFFGCSVTGQILPPQIFEKNLTNKIGDLYYHNIWNRYEKWTEISTSMPGIGSVIRVLLVQ